MNFAVVEVMIQKQIKDNFILTEVRNIGAIAGGFPLQNTPDSGYL
ncbi:hypothetical protein QT989_08500 [Microcoleus sp. SVA1_B6]